jgi:hypothetical protein
MGSIWDCVDKAVSDPFLSLKPATIMQNIHARPRTDVTMAFSHCASGRLFL